MGSFLWSYNSLCKIFRIKGTPLQCSCLENPRDRGAWWAAVHGVAQSQTRLKQLSSSSSNSRITADGDCSHEIKRCLLLGRKALTNLDSVLKSRDITLLTNVHLVKAMVFPIVMYGGESSTRNKPKCSKIHVFQRWYWRSLLRVPWTERRSNQSIINIHWKDWCWSWNSNTLTTRCKEFTH